MVKVLKPSFYIIGDESPGIIHACFQVFRRKLEMETQAEGMSEALGT